jgi:hypothetical protein
MTQQSMFLCAHVDTHLFATTGRRVCRDCGAVVEPGFHNPVTHANDPVTSREAANDITKSGRRKTDAELVLRAVQQMPGHTSSELAAALPQLTLYAVRRRLTDLHHSDQVRQGDPAKRNGNRAEMTWWPNA